MRKKSVGTTSDRSKTNSQTAYQRAKQRDGSPHYVFLYSDDDSSETEEDVALARIRGAGSPPHKVEVIRVLPKADDTLQALALRYSCTISELKRINHIHKENEIFARRHIDVPVRPFSIITENLIDYEVAAANSGENVVPSTRQPDQGISREEHLITLIATPTVPLKLSAATSIHDIIPNSTNGQLGNIADSESCASTKKNETPGSSSTIAIDWFQCSGADWGLRWTHLLGICLLGFAVPLIYIFYIAEKTLVKDGP